EINAGGTMLISYHEHPEYKGEDKSGSVPLALASTIQLYHSLPHIMAPETAEPVVWHLEYFLPFALLENYVGPLGSVAGQQWRANFYKCAEDNSHPHWGAWSPVIEEFDFHQPRFFGVLKFE
ncbi:MAG: carbohydrate-binding family 9-like protein, partial [Candidatus Hydrogenedentes bacterium]|nr:carbohydrate-binding family 9-like protein [Candidatus Hydrogenedentota bacterium]